MTDTEPRRMRPGDLGKAVRAVTIARAGRNKYSELRLYFIETGPEVYFQPNITGAATLRQFLGAPGNQWVGRPIVLAVQRVHNPGTNRAADVVTVANARSWYDVLGISLPALSPETSTDG